MSIPLFDDCKLISNDVGMQLNSSYVFETFQKYCTNDTLLKFTCDVIKTNWDTLWKQFIIDFVNGNYCEILT